MKITISKLCILLLNIIYLHAANQNEINFKKGIQNMNNSILRDTPSFNMKIASERAVFVVYINGVEQFESLSGNNVNLDYPLNGYITDGENEIALMINDTALENAKCSITLFVRKFNDFNVPAKDIVTLSYDQSKKNPLELATKPGNYNIGNSKSITIEKPNISIHKESLTYMENAKLITIKFSVPNSSPRWKYLEGETILHKPFLELQETEYYEIQKHDPKIQALYKLNKEIYNSAKKKDINKLLSFFKERNHEMDLAYYRKPGETEEKLKDALLGVMNDSTLELILSEKDWEERTSVLFFVHKNNKLAYIADVLMWAHIKEDASENFDMNFRYNNGKWVLTR